MNIRPTNSLVRTAVAGLGLAVLASCGESLPTPPENDLKSVTGTFKTGEINYGRTTRIIAVGYSHGQGTQFVQAAVGRAQKYREIFPGDQIVLMGNPEVMTRIDDRKAFEQFGIRVTEYRPDEYLKSSKLIAKMKRFSTIASFDYYGHSSPWSIGVSPKGRRFGVNSKETGLRSIAKRFTGDAYATLNGCNAGLYLGPFLSEIWNIPVAAAATATNFQRLHSDGNWYVNDPGQHPEGAWAKTNNKTYETNQRCNRGYCLRLKPENVPYRGHWGNSKAGGLGFIKFFCKDHRSMKECKRRMAVSTLAYPSMISTNLETTTRDDFREAAFDFLCPNDKTRKRARACRSGIVNALDRGDKVYSPFRGNELRCDFDGCKFKYKCKRDSSGQPVPGSCHMSASTNKRPTNIAREFEALMEGFEELRQTGMRGGRNQPGSGGTFTRQELEGAHAIRIKSPALNCRAQASLNSEIVRVTLKGDRLSVAPGNDGEFLHRDSRGVYWIRVATADNAKCYVSGKSHLIVPLSD